MAINPRRIEFFDRENCDNYYQNWNLIKQEYQCFTNNQKI